MLKNKDIVEGLEICGKNDNCSGDCPYEDMHECMRNLMCDAYDLIKKQDEIITRLIRDGIPRKVPPDRWLTTYLKNMSGLVQMACELKNGRILDE